MSLPWLYVAMACAMTWAVACGNAQYRYAHVIDMLVSMQQKCQRARHRARDDDDMLYKFPPPPTYTDNDYSGRVVDYNENEKYVEKSVATSKKIRRDYNGENKFSIIEKDKGNEDNIEICILSGVYVPCFWI